MPPIASGSQDRLWEIVRRTPNLDEIHPFYRELADAVAGVERLKRSLADVHTVAKLARLIREEYTRKLKRADDPAEAARAIAESAQGHAKPVYGVIMAEESSYRMLPREIPDCPPIYPVPEMAVKACVSPTPSVTSGGLTTISTGTANVTVSSLSPPISRLTGVSPWSV